MVAFCRFLHRGIQGGILLIYFRLKAQNELLLRVFGNNAILRKGPRNNFDFTRGSSCSF